MSCFQKPPQDKLYNNLKVCHNLSANTIVADRIITKSLVDAGAVVPVVPVIDKNDVYVYNSTTTGQITESEQLILTVPNITATNNRGILQVYLSGTNTNITSDQEMVFNIKINGTFITSKLINVYSSANSVNNSLWFSLQTGYSVGETFNIDIYAALALDGQVVDVNVADALYFQQ